MANRKQDRILRLYVCQATDISMYIYVFLEGGCNPRAIAGVQQGSTEVVYVEFPQLPLGALEQRVKDNVNAFSKQYEALVFTIEPPQGCTPYELIEWVQSGSGSIHRHKAVLN